MIRAPICFSAVLVLAGCQATGSGSLHESAVEARQAVPRQSLSEAARVERCVATRDRYGELEESGDATANFEMAELYDVGCAVPHDPFRAYALYKAAAEAGHGKAALRLAHFLAGGKGIAGDWDESLFWFGVADRSGELTRLERRMMTWTTNRMERRLLERGQGDRIAEANTRAQEWSAAAD